MDPSCRTGGEDIAGCAGWSAADHSMEVDLRGYGGPMTTSPQEPGEPAPDQPDTENPDQAEPDVIVPGEDGPLTIDDPPASNAPADPDGPDTRAN
jgi:hypothetical protein